MKNMKAIKIAKQLAEALTEDRKVIKSFPFKPSWKKMYDDAIKLATEMDQLRKRADSKRDLMWSTISEETGVYEDMHINDEKNEVEVYGSEDDE